MLIEFDRQHGKTLNRRDVLVFRNTIKSISESSEKKFTKEKIRIKISV